MRFDNLSSDILFKYVTQFRLRACFLFPMQPCVTPESILIKLSVILSKPVNSFDTFYEFNFKRTVTSFVSLCHSANFASLQ
jgi:hypothetical protein